MKFGSSKRRSLLEDEEGEGDGGKPQQQLTVNEAFAKRFVHNKQREDLHRFEELKKRGLIDSDDDDDDDDDEDEDGELPEDVDLKIFETLTKIKRKDPQIYDPNAVFFEEPRDDDDEVLGFGKKVQAEEEEEEKKKKKPAFLKDVIASQLLEGEGKGEDRKPRVVRTYAQEQQELKDAFLRSVAEADEEDDEGLLRVRKKSKEEIAKEKLEDEAAVVEYERRQKDADINRRLEDYFGKNDDLDDNERFLKEFILNKGWIDRDQNRIPSYEEVVGDVSEEEELIEKQEKYEHDYNFRFEEGSGSQVLGHSRHIEESVRKKLDSRKKKRRQKMERRNEAARTREEELKRLKNLKKKEIMEKLAKIRSIAGVSEDALGADTLGEDLEEDFDPDEYDRKMKDIFGDEYYNDQDIDANFMPDEDNNTEKPDFDAEDEVLGLEKGWDGRKKAGFTAIYEQHKHILNAQQEQDDDLMEAIAAIQREEAVTDKKGKKLKDKISLREKLSFNKQLLDYYKLDYEDIIGDLPTRFKYHQVKPNTYGLSAEEILTRDDKELNQFVSIKKLAPYRSDEWEPPRRHRPSKKARKLHS